jgi:uncharacterized protein (TIGR03067 family)
MTRYGITLLTVGLVLVVSQARAEDKGDKDKLQGEWSLVSYELDGECVKTTKDHVMYHSFKIEGVKIRYTRTSGECQDSTFAVDSSKKPKTIDITHKDFGGKKGLYELDGDTLKICSSIFLRWDSFRPAALKSKADVVVYTYERVKK